VPKHTNIYDLVKDAAQRLRIPRAEFGNVDSHKNAAVRAVLEPISELADRLGVAILALTHFSKQTANRAIYRFIGSIAQIGAARVAFAVVADPEDKTRILLLHAKNNLAPAQKGLGLRIQQHPVTADGVIGSSVFFEPNHVTDVSADEALVAENGVGQTTAKDEVKEFLLTILANGPVKIQDIEAEARSAGLLGGDKQMRETKPFRSAKAELQIVSTHEGFGRDAVYYWSMPEQTSDTADATMRAPEATMRAHHKNRAHMEDEGAHEEHGDHEGAHERWSFLHVRPQTPCAPSFCEGAHEDKGLDEGAHARNGQDLTDGDLTGRDPTIPSFLDRRSGVLGSRVCAQCRAGRPDDQPTINVTGKHSERLWVHEQCLRFWKKENANEPA
jgi:hypothetical protein